MSDMTPLMSATLSIDEDTTAVKKLLDTGADVNAATRDGYTALHFAAMADWNEDDDGRMRVLLAAQPDLDAVAMTQAGGPWTPLMLAAAEGYSSQLRALVEAGANIELADELGRTALMLAADQNCETFEKIAALVDGGADLGKMSESGMTAFAYASRYYKWLVDEHGGKLPIQETEKWKAVLELLKS